MKKKDNSEDIQSRREFFKNAAKGILPILGVMLLTGEPLIGKNSDVAMGCKYGCSSGCYTACSGSCKSGCDGSCQNACYGCQYTCSGGCKNSCRATCMHSSSR